MNDKQNCPDQFSALSNALSPPVRQLADRSGGRNPKFSKLILEFYNLLHPVPFKIALQYYLDIPVIDRGLYTFMYCR
jgi:hypothetical protein